MSDSRYQTANRTDIGRKKKDPRTKSSRPQQTYQQGACDHVICWNCHDSILVPRGVLKFRCKRCQAVLELEDNHSANHHSNRENVENVPFLLPCSIM